MFPSTNSSPFFLPHYLPHAPNLARSLLPDNQTGPSGLLASALPSEESMQKVMYLKLRSDPQWLCSPVQGFLAHPGGHALDYTPHGVLLLPFPLSGLPLPLGWSCSAWGFRHPCISSSLLLYFWAAMNLVTVCIPLAIGDHLCVFLGPSRLCFPKGRDSVLSL